MPNDSVGFEKFDNNDENNDGNDDKDKHKKKGKKIKENSLGKGGGMSLLDQIKARGGQ